MITDVGVVLGSVLYILCVPTSVRLVKQAVAVVLFQKRRVETC